MTDKKALDKLSGLFDQAKQRLGQKAAHCFFLSKGKEKRRRLEWIMRMTKEYERVVEIDRFSTALMLLDMESVIDGDWEYLSKTEHFWSYESESAELRARYAPLHAPWRELLQGFILESDPDASQA